MKNATVVVRGISRTYDVTARKAHYKIMLPEGQYELEVKCHGYNSKVVPVRVPKDQIVSYDVILNKAGNAPTTVHVITEESNEPVRPSGTQKSGIEGEFRSNRILKLNSCVIRTMF